MILVAAVFKCDLNYFGIVFKIRIVLPCMGKRERRSLVSCAAIIDVLCSPSGEPTR